MIDMGYDEFVVVKCPKLNMMEGHPSKEVVLCLGYGEVSEKLEICNVLCPYFSKHEELECRYTDKPCVYPEW